MRSDEDRYCHAFKKIPKVEQLKLISWSGAAYEQACASLFEAAKVPYAAEPAAEEEKKEEGEAVVVAAAAIGNDRVLRSRQQSKSGLPSVAG